MTADPLRRRLLAGIVASPMLSAPAWAANDDADTPASDAAETTYALGDIALGPEDAKVTVIEYASFTCPHCAAFHINTWPDVKEQYVDTGKIRFILREVYFDKYGLWASMAARCGGEAGYYPMVDTFLQTQRVWTKAPDIGHAIHQIGRRAGLSNEMLDACLSDRDYAKALLKSYQDNAEADGVQSTPTFIVNGDLHSGNMSFEAFSAIIDAAL